MATKIMTGKCRLSYVSVFEPKEQQGGEPKYSLTLLIPKSDTATVEKIKAAMNEARDNFCKRNGANALPVKFNHTMHDGDGVRESGDPYGPECRGCYVMTVTSKQKPLILDSLRNNITDPAELYSGCYGRASINFYGYANQGKKGVSAGLLGVQKLSEGEPFGTVASVDDFDDDFAEGSDNDFLS